MPLVFDIADNEDRILLPCTTFSDVWNYFRQYSDYNPQNSDEIDTMEDESAILTFGQFALLFPFMRLFKHKSIQRTTNDNRSHTIGTRGERLNQKASIIKLLHELWNALLNSLKVLEC